jgi:hypothetical protein
MKQVSSYTTAITVLGNADGQYSDSITWQQKSKIKNQKPRLLSNAPSIIHAAHRSFNSIY